jgi:hypothetical protein
MQVAGVGEISDVGEVRSLADLHPGERFGDKKVQVGIALAVGIGRQIDRHVVPEDRQVGAMVEIIAAQIVLVGLA